MGGYLFYLQADILCKMPHSTEEVPKSNGEEAPKNKSQVPHSPTSV